MKTLLLILATLFVFACSSTPETPATPPPETVKMKKNRPPAPTVAKKPKHMENFGDVRIDNYFWLKERTNPKVLDYLKAENKYYDTIMKPTLTLQKDLFKEMKSRIKEDDASYPAKYGKHLYYARYEIGKQYPIHARKKILSGNTPETYKTGPEEILFDVNVMAKGHNFFSTTSANVSTNENIAAIGIDTVGRRFYTIKFKDLKTGKMLPDQIKNVTDNFVWANDNKTIFVTKQHPDTLRWERIISYKLGANKKPKEVYFEKVDTYENYLGKSANEDLILLTVGSTLSTEQHIIPADKPDEKPLLVVPREKTHENHLDADEKYFYLVSNKDAKNFKIVRALRSDLPNLKWQDYVEHRSDVTIASMSIFKDFVAIQSRSNGLTNIEIKIKDSGDVDNIPFKDESYVASFGTNLEYDTPYFRYRYETMKQPPSEYDFQVKEEKSYLRKVKEIPNYDMNKYEVKREWAEAHDGRDIPVSILMKKGTELNGKNPTLVYAYGSYGASEDPDFNPNIISLVDRGYVFAIAHIRGGGEMGRYWVDEGRVLNKKNTFMDFISSTEHLIKKGYSDPKRIFAMGGSAGGLLMGAITNMRPDLYAGVVAQVPFVDVINTMLDDTIPLTTAEYDEWGNPNIKEFYDYIRTYSPYENVSKKAYPNMLITTGLHDSQVQYWEPAKWTATLRDNNTGDSVILLHTNMEAGHGGKTGRFDRLKERARDYAFIIENEKL